MQQGKSSLEKTFIWGHAILAAAFLLYGAWQQTKA